MNTDKLGPNIAGSKRSRGLRCGDEIEGDGQNRVKGQHHQPFHPVCFSVQADADHDDDRQRHGHDPARAGGLELSAATMRLLISRDIPVWPQTHKDTKQLNSTEVPQPSAPLIV